MIKRHGKFFMFLVYIFLIVGSVSVIIPAYLAIITALKTPAESAKDFFALPRSINLDNFREVIVRGKYPVYLLNSSIITCFSLILIILIAPLASYGIARNFDKKYYKFLFAYITLGMFIPFQVIMIPVAKLASQLHMLSQSGIIILYTTYGLIQSVFLYVNYIKTIPIEIEEAATIDGCSKIGTYMRIVFPVLKPMTATITVMNTLWIWNDFLLPFLILNRSQKFWTLQLFQFNFKSQYMFDYNLAFASFLLSAIPIVFAYLFLQKYIISGITSGAVKG